MYNIHAGRYVLVRVSHRGLDCIYVGRTENAVSLGEWHTVRASRTGRVGQLTVDEQSTSMEGISPGRFTQLTLTNTLYVGGSDDWKHVFHSAGVNRSFRGCIQLASISFLNEYLLNKSPPTSAVNMTLPAFCCWARRLTALLQLVACYRLIYPARGALSSKPSGDRCCCRAMGQTDGHSIDS